MSVKDKMVNRLLSMPNDYTFLELKGLSSKLGCVIQQDRNGSRCALITQSGSKYIFHKPHSYSYFRSYVIKDLISFLRKEGLI